MGTFTPVIDTHTHEQTFFRVTSTLARWRQVYSRLTLSILTILGVFSNIFIPLLWRLILGLILPLHAMLTINHCFGSRFPFSSVMEEIMPLLSGTSVLPGPGRMTHWSCVPSLFTAQVVKKKVPEGNHFSSRDVTTVWGRGGSRRYRLLLQKRKQSYGSWDLWKHPWWSYNKNR